MGEDEYDPPSILGRPFLSTVKAIVDTVFGHVSGRLMDLGSADEKVITG